MTNESFLFGVKGSEYICRIPGKGTERFISRRQEAEVYKVVAPLDIADEVVYLNPETGVKITRFYAGAQDVADHDWPAIRACMGILRTLHTAGLHVSHPFNIIQKANDFEAMCRDAGIALRPDFGEVKAGAQVALGVIRSTGQPLVLCHGDSAHVNFLKLADGRIRLLDWEYGGMCHAVADVAMFGVFSDYPIARIDELLTWYCGGQPTPEERLLCFAYYAASGFLWGMWAQYREHFGEDFGEYASVQYRIARDGAALVKQLLQDGK